MGKNAVTSCRGLPPLHPHTLEQTLEKAAEFGPNLLADSVRSRGAFEADALGLQVLGHESPRNAETMPGACPKGGPKSHSPLHWSSHMVGSVSTASCS